MRNQRGNVIKKDAGLRKIRNAANMVFEVHYGTLPSSETAAILGLLARNRKRK
jgi:hypothetical protein